MKTTTPQTERLTQNQMIAKHLRSGKHISPMKALNLYGCFRLASRIVELKASGMNIETKMIYAGAIKFARYKLVKPKTKSL